MATIGRDSAVVEFPNKRTLHGPLAYFAWLGVLKRGHRAPPGSPFLCSETADLASHFPPTGRHIVHGLDFTRNCVAVFREMFANLSSRFIDTLAAHNAIARMDPKAIVRTVLGEQCGTFDGVQLYKNLIKVAHEEFRTGCVH